LGSFFSITFPFCFHRFVTCEINYNRLSRADKKFFHKVIKCPKFSGKFQSAFPLRCRILRARRRRFRAETRTFAASRNCARPVWFAQSRFQGSFAAQKFANAPITVRAERVRLVSDAELAQIFHFFDQTVLKMPFGALVDSLIQNERAAD
jgi:hypothetical protein